MKKITVILSALVLLSACAPQTPIATAANTPTQQILLAAQPTSTPLPSPTFTPTPDLGVFTQPAQNFKLTLSDLPKGYLVRFAPVCQSRQPECKLASDRSEGPHLNFEALLDIGGNAGGAYVNDTLRIEGWYVYFNNDKGDASNPDMVMSNVIRFVAAKGARKHIESYAAIDLDLNEYTEVHEYAVVGDLARAYVRLHRGTKYVLYQFSYRNIVHRILVGGQDATVTPEFVQGLAQKALAKLQAAELSTAPRFPFPPTLTPQPNSPTPDARVITDKPFTFILSTQDLPAAGAYYRPLDKDALNRQSNAETTVKYINGLGAEYVRETSRMDGWSIRYNCGTQNALLPAQITHNVIMFETAQGAQKHMREYLPRLIDANWREGAPLNQIGDVTRVFVKQDGVYASYLLEFSYRNYAHSLTVYGMQAEIDPAFVEMVAFTLLRNLQAAPLADSLAK
jgi:hypothetical protein